MKYFENKLLNIIQEYLFTAMSPITTLSSAAKVGGDCSAAQVVIPAVLGDVLAL